MVIVSTEGIEKDFRIWKRVEENIKKKTSSTVDLVVHNIHFVNEQLLNGVPFFIDIKQDGIVLYQNSHAEKLVNAKNISQEERKRIAEQDFEIWSEHSKNALKIYSFCLKENVLRDAAFNLHQTIERLFTALQLVYTRYNPKEHNIIKLSEIVSHFGFDIHKFFPGDTEEEKHLFKLLCQSYVQARYSPNFVITKEELGEIAKRVKKIEKEVTKLCKKKMKEIEKKILEEK